MLFQNSISYHGARLCRNFPTLAGDVWWYKRSTSGGVGLFHFQNMEAELEIVDPNIARQSLLGPPARGSSTFSHVWSAGDTTCLNEADGCVERMMPWARR